jgi:xylulokinase
VRHRRCLVGLDIGSSSIKAVAIDVENGSCMARSSRTTPLRRDPHGRVEAPAQAFRHAVDSVLSGLVSQLPDADSIHGIATASVGECGSLVDAVGNASDIIWWQDTRSSAQVEQLVAEVGASTLDAIVGHPVDPTWGIGRLMWWRDHDPRGLEAGKVWLPVADLVTWWLTGVRVTSTSLASRQMCLDQATGHWSSRVLKAAQIDPEVLPAVASSGERVGTVSAAASRRTGLPPGVHVSLGGHDRQCGAFAARGGTAAAVDSAGTAEGLLLPQNGRADVPARVGTGIAYYADVVPGASTLAGRLGLAGGLIDWARALFGAESNAELLNSLAFPLHFNGVVGTSTFGRYTSPWWAPGAVPGALAGLTTSHSRDAVVQALAEAPAYALRANLDLFEDWQAGSTSQVRVEGGIAANPLLMQVRADIVGRQLHSIEESDLTARGAALLAGVGSGMYSTHREAGVAWPLRLRDWSPDAQRSMRYNDAYQQLFLPLIGASQAPCPPTPSARPDGHAEPQKGSCT